MMRKSKLFALGSLAGAAAIATIWYRRSRSFENRVTSEFPAVGIGADFSPGVTVVGEIDDSATYVGIADVDPQPLTEISGEGIDPDAVEAAHNELRDLRERMPQPGKNLP